MDIIHEINIIYNLLKSYNIKEGKKICSELIYKLETERDLLDKISEILK